MILRVKKTMCLPGPLLHAARLAAEAPRSRPARCRQHNSAGFTASAQGPADAAGAGPPPRLLRPASLRSSHQPRVAARARQGACAPPGRPRPGPAAPAPRGEGRAGAEALAAGTLPNLSFRIATLPMDLIGFGYAALVTFGSILGYKRRGGLPSLIAGLFVGFLAGYGAYRVSNDKRDVKLSLFTAFFLATIMGVRYKRSKKIMPAGLVAGLSLMMILRLVLLLL
uniref:Transmembrane protein 14A n=1 Tax=Canis lupus familiaris TaxID=9615 RepID=A0A8I3RVA4_CANLF